MKNGVGGRGSSHADVSGLPPSASRSNHEASYNSALFDELDVVCVRQDFLPGNGMFSSVLLHAVVCEARSC